MSILNNLFENNLKHLDGIKSSIVVFNPFIYFSAGESLNDKDSDYNIDSLAIHKFFKPIDNLFGDYEVKKKFNLEKTIFTKGLFEKPNNFLPNLEDYKALKINRKEKEFKFSIKDTKGKIINSISYKNAIIFFVIFYDRKTYTLKVDGFISKSEIINSNSKANFLEGITKKIGKNFNVLQILALDPEKLIQIVDLDKSRIRHFKKVIERNENININKINIFLGKVFSVKARVSVFDIYTTETQNEILKNLGDWAKDKDFLMLLDLFTNRTYKLKNFEAHKYFKARLGFEDGHYVLFLHPYESESNNPVRFPPRSE